MNRRGFLARLAFAPVALVVGYKDERDENGHRTITGGTVEIPEGGTVRNCTFEDVTLKVGASAVIADCCFRQTQPKAAVEVADGAWLRGS